MRPRGIAVIVGVTMLAALAVATPADAKSEAKAAAKKQPVVVSLGDSYISGEAGRWAGNTNDGYTKVDALGPTAYFDNANQTAEVIDGCHRSRTSEIHIGGAVQSVNLACSGATTATKWNSDSQFKPGLDFYDDGNGHLGQAAMLQSLASTSDVKMIVVSIGGNDFKFAKIIEACVKDFLLSSSLFPDYCYDDSSVLAYINSAAVTTVRADIAAALQNIRQAMRNAGRKDGSYDVVVQTYPSPLPPGNLIRYPQSGYTRQSTGGCGFWNDDADWANSTVLPLVNQTVREAVVASGLTRIHVLDNNQAFVGRRLCENTVGLLEEKSLATWQSANAVDLTEWVDQVRTVSTVVGPYSAQESFHPNYWGQQALQACVRLAWNNGKVRGGTCTRSANGLKNGDPVMRLR